MRVSPLFLIAWLAIQDVFAVIRSVQIRLPVTVIRKVLNSHKNHQAQNGQQNFLIILIFNQLL